MHGDGNGGNGNGADGARPTFEQALKELGPPRDRVDQLILFVAQTWPARSRRRRTD
jgi:hypothetical protein